MKFNEFHSMSVSYVIYISTSTLLHRHHHRCCRQSTSVKSNFISVGTEKNIWTTKYTENSSHLMAKCYLQNKFIKLIFLSFFLISISCVCWGLFLVCFVHERFFFAFFAMMIFFNIRKQTNIYSDVICWSFFIFFKSQPSTKLKKLWIHQFQMVATFTKTKNIHAANFQFFYNNFIFFKNFTHPFYTIAHLPMWNVSAIHN